jgi:hypothetical protein
MNSGVAPPVASFIRHQCDAEMPRKRAGCRAMPQRMLHRSATAPKSGIQRNRSMAAMSFLFREVINLM